ncbi:MAG: HPr family phosphocarrier protein [Pseudomonadota bacterium]
MDAGQHGAGTPRTPEGPVANRVLEIVNKRGLHARASAKFVKCAECFDADITVSKDGQNVCGTSIMGLLTLGASLGCSIAVSASGPDAEKAIEAIGRLVDSGFGEDCCAPKA